jgi:uncharacterized protein DUF6632
MSTSYRMLQIAVAVTGVAFIPNAYFLWVVWPSGWAWESVAPYQSHMFMMIFILYATLGVFLLNAARDPQANLSLIWFAAISSLLHSALMAAQSISMGHLGHLLGDVLALFIVGVVLVALLLTSGLKQPRTERARLRANEDVATQA